MFASRRGCWLHGVVTGHPSLPLPNGTGVARGSRQAVATDDDQSSRRDSERCCLSRERGLCFASPASEALRPSPARNGLGWVAGCAHAWGRRRCGSVLGNPVAAHLVLRTHGSGIQEIQQPRGIRALPMARPGLEPGTPRFSGSRGSAISLLKDLQICGFQPGAVWHDRVGSGRFREDLGLRRGLDVPMSLRPARPTGRVRCSAVEAVESRGTRLPGPRRRRAGWPTTSGDLATSRWRCATLVSLTGGRVACCSPEHVRVPGKRLV